jgi:hypothetical protein
MLIFFVSLYYIYTTLIEKKSISDIGSLFSNLNYISLVVVFMVFVMMFINWFIESIKWKLLISKLQHLSFFTSYKAVLTGLTVNTWIPNRLAEFIGRILYLEQENRTKATFSTLVGGFAQLIATTLAGSLGLIFWFSSGNDLVIILIALLLVNGFLLLAYFNVSIFSGIIKKISFLKKLWQYVEILEEYSSPQLLELLILSFTRYAVYCTQYYLLFLVFGIDFGLLQTFMCISLIFLSLSVIPAVTLTEIGVRGATVLYFTGFYTDNSAGVLAAAYLIWLINIIIPAIAGAFLLLKIKYPSKVVL